MVNFQEKSKERTSEMRHKSSSTVTLRAIIIGLILLPINAYWIGASSELWYSLHMTSASLFFNAVFNLFFLALLNLCLRKFLPSFALSQAELLAIYTMLVMLSTVCGHTMMCFLLGTLSHPFWFATVENEYAELFHKYIPQWFTLRDKRILSGFFEGNSTFYTAEHIKAWLSPVLLWSAITFLLFFLFMCMSVIIRKQWTEKEKLSYPIVRLPIEMTAQGFFSSKFMWTGFAIAAIIDIVNGLNFYYPAVPYIPIKNYGISFFTEKPWNALGALNVSFYPFVIGLTYFVPLNMAFSVWFFYLFVRAQRIIGSIWGLRALPRFPYINEQGEGAWIILGFLALWASKSHLKRVLKRIFLRKSELDDSDEPLGYRSAFLYIIIGMIFLILLLYKAGMSLAAILFYFVVFFAMSIAITRVRAKVGPPVHEVIWMHPQGVMVKAWGTRRVGGANMTILSFLYPFNRDNAAHPMPSQLEGFKIAERMKMNSKQLMWAMVLALAVSILASFWIYLQIMYEYGASAKARGYIVGIGRETFGQLSSWLQYPHGTDYPAVGVMGAASLFTIFLMIMSRRFIWWPFHPAGYALGTSAGTGWFWAAVLAGWVIKTVILKYGGLKAYRRGLPFFLGLIIGEYVVGCGWSLIGVVFGTSTYRVWS